MEDVYVDCVILITTIEMFVAYCGVLVFLGNNKDKLSSVY